MERGYANENRKARERLIKMVKDMTDEELNLIIYKEGWTIAVALGHMAFWDMRRLELVKRWQRGELVRSDIDGVDMHTINDALVTLFLSMPPRRVTELAISAAEAVDKALTNLPADVLPSIEAMNDRGALDRAFHRKMHLDEIEVFLKEIRK
jgi:hypothetical protein